MRNRLHVRLAFREEIVLRRVAHGAEQGRLGQAHLLRLQQLMLVERRGGSWRLTALGRQLYGSLAKPLLLTQPLGNEIDRILAKYHS